MSHFTTIKTQIKDIDSLRSALQEMGLSLLQKTTARGYYENNVKGDYVIRLKGPYDIAVNKQKDGTFELTCDWWAGHVEKEVGQNFWAKEDTAPIYPEDYQVKARGSTWDYLFGGVSTTR